MNLLGVRRSKSASQKEVSSTGVTATGATTTAAATATMPQHHVPPIKLIGIDPSRNQIGGGGGHHHKQQLGQKQQQQQQQRPMYPPNCHGLSSISDHEDIKNRSFRQHQKMKLQSPLHHQLSPQWSHKQQQQQHNEMNHQQYHPSMPQQYHPNNMVPSQQQHLRNSRLMHLSQNIPPYNINGSNHRGDGRPMNQQPPPHQQQTHHSPKSVSSKINTASPLFHSPGKNPIAMQHPSNNTNHNRTSSSSVVPWATYTPTQKSPHRNPNLSQNYMHRPTNVPNPSPSQRHAGSIREPPFGQQHQQPMYAGSDWDNSGGGGGNHLRASTSYQTSHYRPGQQEGGMAHIPANRSQSSKMAVGPTPPYHHHHHQQQQHLPPQQRHPLGNPRTSMSSSQQQLQTTTTKDVVMHFNTNGSAKHVDRTIRSSDDKPMLMCPPCPIHDTAGSRIRLFFGATRHEFVLLLQEDDGNRSWQSKIWCNIPIGLDLKLHTLDTVHYCSFARNDWFILTQCDQTGKYKSYWDVESGMLHSTLTTYAQNNTYLRLVFGENGQYVILHGTNGYQVGSNIPTQLEMALDRAYTSGSNIVGVHGLNAQGRFIVHLQKNEGSNNSSLNAVDVQHPLASFCAQGLSPELDQVLRATNKLEKFNFVLSCKDASWILVRDHSFEQTNDIHYDLVTELDGFYGRHKKRVEKRTEEISKFYENDRMRKAIKNVDIDSNHAVSVIEITMKPTDTEEVNEKTVVDDALDENKPIAEVNAPLIPDNVRRSDDNPTKVTVVEPDEQNSKRKKKLKPSAFRAQRLLNKEDRISDLIRKGIITGDRVTVLGVSVVLGDSIVKSIETSDASVTVVVPNDTGGKRKVSGEKTIIISDIRRVIKYVEGDQLTNYSGVFQGPLAMDKYEAAMQLFHIHCKDSACDCKINFFGCTERFQQPSLWKTGDRVSVGGYTDGIVISSNPKYSSKPYLVHVQYDDGTSYHVRSDQVRPTKRYIDPGSCCFASLREYEESALRLRPIVDETELTPFDEYKCPERVDHRRLQRLVANLRSDSDQRKECMKSLVVTLDENPNDELADQCYSQLEHCYDLEEALFMLYDHVKGLPMDDNGYVTYEVQYSHKNFACRGRLFSIGRSVLVLPGKFPRTATMQGLHAECRATLNGAFAHEVHVQNSDVRLLNSLAQQLALDDMIPTLKDYCYNPDSWIEIIREEHPHVDVSNIKRLVSIIVCGGTYETWLGLVGEDDVVPKLKRFGFRMASEIQALYDQLVYHPRFQWTFLERKKLESMGFNDATVKTILCLRILQASENEVLGMIHRNFHDHGWIVRTKIFDSIIVECGPSAKEEHSTTETMMRIAESYCETLGWDISLIEDELHGCEDRPLMSFMDARSSMRKYLRKMNDGAYFSDDEYTSADRHDDDDLASLDDDDDLVTTVTRSVGTLSHSHDEIDDEFDGSNTRNNCVVEEFGDSNESLDIENEYTFHDDSEEDMVRSIELPPKYRVNDGNNGSKDSIGHEPTYR